MEDNNDNLLIGGFKQKIADELRKEPQNQDIFRLADLHYQVALTYKRKNQLNDVRQHCGEALEYLNSILKIEYDKNETERDVSKIANYNERLAKICEILGNNEKALEYWYEAALGYKSIDKYDKALNCLNVANKYEDSPQKKLEYNFLMGTLHELLGNFHKALDIYNATLSTKLSIDNYVRAHAFQNAGIIQKLLGTQGCLLLNKPQSKDSTAQDNRVEYANHTLNFYCNNTQIFQINLATREIHTFGDYHLTDHQQQYIAEHMNKLQAIESYEILAKQVLDGKIHLGLMGGYPQDSNILKESLDKLERAKKLYENSHQTYSNSRAGRVKYLEELSICNNAIEEITNILTKKESENVSEQQDGMEGRKRRKARHHRHHHMSAPEPDTENTRMEEGNFHATGLLNTIQQKLAIGILGGEKHLDLMQGYSRTPGTIVDSLKDFREAQQSYLNRNNGDVDKVDIADIDEDPTPKVARDTSPRKYLPNLNLEENIKIKNGFIHLDSHQNDPSAIRRTKSEGDLPSTHEEAVLQRRGSDPTTGRDL